ncbi:MAG: hypothetical protein QOI95_3083, partial [Acidimicrobiaceae bacterium]
PLSVPMHNLASPELAIASHFASLSRS